MTKSANEIITSTRDIPNLFGASARPLGVITSEEGVFSTHSSPEGAIRRLKSAADNLGATHVYNVRIVGVGDAKLTAYGDAFKID